MNMVDVAVLLIVALSGMMGLARGLVREVFGLLAWLGAAFAAWYFFPQAQGMARRTIANEGIADPVAFGLVFLVVLVMLSLLARSLATLTRYSGLGGLDRTLGLVYGLGRGAVLMVAAYFAAGAVEPVDRWPDMVLEARSLPSIYLGANWFADRLPAEIRPAVPVPPAGRSTSSADLLHANPVGRALAAPPLRP